MTTLDLTLEGMFGFRTCKNASHSCARFSSNFLIIISPDTACWIRRRRIAIFGFLQQDLGSSKVLWSITHVPRPLPRLNVFGDLFWTDCETCKRFVAYAFFIKLNGSSKDFICDSFIVCGKYPHWQVRTCPATSWLTFVLSLNVLQYNGSIRLGEFSY